MFNKNRQYRKFHKYTKVIKKNTEFGYIALALNMFYGAHKKKLESDCDSTTMRRKKKATNKK